MGGNVSGKLTRLLEKEGEEVRLPHRRIEALGKGINWIRGVSTQYQRRLPSYHLWTPWFWGRCAGGGGELGSTPLGPFQQALCCIMHQCVWTWRGMIQLRWGCAPVSFLFHLYWREREWSAATRNVIPSQGSPQRSLMQWRRWRQ